MQRLKSSLRAVAVIVLAFVTLAIPASPVLGDSTTSPGKGSVFVAHQGYDSCCSVPLGGTISRGRAEHVLLVDVTFKVVNTWGCSPTDIDIWPPEVNGVMLHPDDAGSISASATCNGVGVLCPTITGTYWLDLDAAEAAHPQTFINKLLNITAQGRWYGVACSVFTSASMAARLIKK